MERRKSDISAKLEEIKRETEVAIELVRLLYEDTQNNLVERTLQVNDPKVFLQQYPSITVQLSDRLSHLVNFNCWTEALLDDTKSTVAPSEQIAANDVLPAPQQQIVLSGVPSSFSIMGNSAPASSPALGIDSSSGAAQTQAMSAVLHRNQVPISQGTNGHQSLNTADDIKLLSLLDKSVENKDIWTIQLAELKNNNEQQGATKCTSEETPSTSTSIVDAQERLEGKPKSPLLSSAISETSSSTNEAQFQSINLINSISEDQCTAHGNALLKAERPQEKLITPGCIHEHSSVLQGATEVVVTQSLPEPSISRSEGLSSVHEDATLTSELPGDVPMTPLVATSSGIDSSSLPQSSAKAQSPPKPSMSNPKSPSSVHGDASEPHEEKPNTSLMSDSNKELSPVSAQTQTKLQVTLSPSSAELTRNEGSALASRQHSKGPLSQFVPFCIEKSVSRRNVEAQSRSGDQLSGATAKQLPTVHSVGTSPSREQAATTTAKQLPSTVASELPTTTAKQLLSAPVKQPTIHSVGTSPSREQAATTTAKQLPCTIASELPTTTAKQLLSALVKQPTVHSVEKSPSRQYGATFAPTTKTTTISSTTRAKQSSTITVGTSPSREQSSSTRAKQPHTGNSVDTLPSNQLPKGPVTRVVPFTSENSVSQILSSVNGSVPPATNTSLLRIDKSEDSVKSGATNHSNQEPFLGFKRNAVEFQDVWFGILEVLESPSEFYVHIASAESITIDDFYQKLQTFYNETKSTFISKYEAKEGLGNFCACYFPQGDGGWYRGQVLDWCWDEDEVLVQIVDYGSKYKATIEMLRPLHEDFKQQPLFATRCHLAFVKRPGKFPNWPDSSIEAFKAATRKCCAYEIIPLGWEEMSTSLNLNHYKSASVMLIPKTPGKQNINDTMISSGFADIDNPRKNGLKETKSNIHVLPNSNDKVLDWFHRTSSSSSEGSRVKSAKELMINSDREKEVVTSTYVTPSTPQQDPLDLWDPMEEAFENPDYDDENACIAVSGHDAKDEFRICKFFATPGGCYKGAKCQKEHSYMRKDGYTTDKELIFCRAFNEIYVPAKGSYMCLEVTLVLLNNCFYAIEHHDPGFTQDNETLLTLVGALNTPINVRNFKRLQITPALQQIVVARYESDGRWYRAKVVDSCNDSGLITVFFVDYGNTALVPEKYVRAIDARFLHLPFQARQFSLANVMLYSDRLASAAEYLHSIVVNKRLVALIHDYSEVLDILYCTLSDNGADIGVKLVERGFGVLALPTDHIQLRGRICYENNVQGARYFPG